MATTINSYSVGFGMDASGYIDGAKISRSETRKLIKDIEGARTPTEKYAREQDRLTEAYKKGAIDLKTYNRLLDDKKTKLGIGQSSLIPYGAAITAVTAAQAALVAGGVAFVHHLRDVQAQIDDVADSAGKLGLSYNELSGLRFAAQEGGGVDAATTDAAIKKMLINTAKAVDGDKATREAFSKLGLDAGQLIQAGPVAATMQIADALSQVNDQGEKLKLTMDIFGKSGTELVSTLDQGSAAIQEAVDFQEKWNSLTLEQTTAVGANNDAWDRISVLTDGISTKLAAEFAPAMHLVADLILDTSDELTDVDSSVRSIVDNVVLFVGHMKDLFELANVINATLYNTATLNFEGVAEGIDAALDITSGATGALESLYKKRDELEKAAAARQQELDERRRNLLDDEGQKQETPLLADGAEALYEKHLADELQRQKVLEQEKMRALEQEEQRRNQMAKSALDAAKKEFDEREKRHRQLQADVAKGPGAGIEAGSAEAAKFLADQVNAELGAQAVPDLPTPGETELLAEAQRQLEAMKDQSEKMDQQIALLRQLAEKEPPIVRLR
jgi:hypothetical protein